MYVGCRKNAEKLPWLAEVPWSFLGPYLAKKKTPSFDFFYRFVISTLVVPHSKLCYG